GEGQFNGLSGIAVDVAGNVYASDESNNRVQKFGPDGSFKVAWGGSPNSTPGPGVLFQPKSVVCLGNMVLVGSVVATTYGYDGAAIKVFQFLSTTPADRETWGAVKARYRLGRATAQVR